MINGVTDITSDRDLKEWLKRFFASTDSKRKSRGFTLYNQRAVLDFQDKIFGFTAMVKGSKRYSVSAFFEGVNKAGLPHLDKALFICSCPDDAVICKHTIAAVIKWAVDMDWKRKTAKKLEPRKAAMSQRKPVGGPTLKKLEELAKKTAPVSFAKQHRLDWVFHPEIDEVFNTIQNVIKREMK
ncbi:hypothetical protein GCM10011391_12840 [Pullulanibacillus camelliae]|uniref:SWIM-type domain-containing protein n=1 Tax=Pullulanibacillus camelliae TaxID=1707096 RepID=A0A8J2VNF6_9BACL|nr:hypothetical protein [Pullulanibacillus camelliae]GGE35547.1 hypothetical protein GCM10011391_12840 [Pullulanibacillus camelliae]